MPCHNVSHTHNWPRSGSLSIAKCESKCDFCASSKDYKPASALRKHVLTHIKNDELPLTLEKSTGGRPRLQTVSCVPASIDQPELPPSGSEVPMATKPVLGNSSADEFTVEPHDNSPPSPNDLLGLKSKLLESDLRPRYRLQCMLEAVKVGKEVLGLSKTSGPMVYCLGELSSVFLDLSEGLDCLRESLLKYLFHHKRNTSLAGYHYRDHPCWVRIEHTYLILLTALRDATQKILPPFSSATVLDVFYVTMVLSVIRRNLYDTESRRGVLGPEGDRRGASTRHLSNQPMMIVLESSDRNLYALFDHVRSMMSRAYVEQEKAKGSPWYSDPFRIIHLIPKFGAGHALVEQLNDLVYQLESNWGLAGTVSERVNDIRV